MKSGHLLRSTAFVLCAALGLACGSDRFIVIGTASAPSTSGFIEIADRGEPAQIIVHLEHLHPPKRMDPDARAYAVWLDDGQSPPRFAGVLRYDPDNRVGELRTDSPYRKFVVNVTAEANDTPAAPSELLVASQEISLDD